MEQRPADEPEQDHRGADQPEDRVDLAAALQLGGVRRRRRRIDLGQRGTQGAVEVAAAQERQHVVLEDRLALAVAQEGGLEPRAGVQLDLAVPAAVVHVEEDHQAVVEALAADVPLVHERARPRLGLRPSLEELPSSWL